MNSIPMVTACTERQWINEALTCSCGGDRPIGCRDCASCALKKEIAFHESIDAKERRRR